MGANLDIVRGEDGALYLVGEVDGAKHVFGSLNASQVAADRVEQGKDDAPQNASEPYLGAYTGPASDISPSPHLAGESVGAPAGDQPPPDQSAGDSPESQPAQG